MLFEYNKHMKQQLTLKQELKQTKKFNTSKASSLKILELNNDALLTYIKSQVSNNPFISISGYHEDSDAFLNYEHDTRSLYDEVMEQLRFTNENPDLELCEMLIANLDNNGYFKVSKQELRQIIPCSDKEYKRNLTILRKCEPYGCFTFNLEECLKLQCILSKERISQSALLLCNHLKAIATQDMQTLLNETKLSEGTIMEAIHFIRTLNPKPAANYSREASYTNPEFKIEVIDKQINIALLQDDLKVFINEADHPALSQVLKEQRAQITTLMSYVQRRNATLMQIMQCICDIQKDFFLHHKDMVHCTQQMIASKLGVNVSTVSRAINNKSCEFEHHYYLLSAFLHNGGSKEHSQVLIKNRIKTIIEQEDKNNPLSDEQIRNILKEEGIQISRRTITKYRESSFIFSSRQRKRQI